MTLKSSSTKYFFKRASKVLTTILAFIINTFGFVFSVSDIRNAVSDTEKYAFMILCIAEFFLIISVIYSVYSFAMNYNSKETSAIKTAELQRCRNANRIIFENQKNIISYYKDFSDRLKSTVHKFDANRSLTMKIINTAKSSNSKNSKQMQKDLNESLEKQVKGFGDSLIEQYNRFMVKTIDVLKDNIEEYLSSKGCSATASVAIKQLSQEVSYPKIDDQIANIYTAFRDSSTYWRRKRTETWEKKFSISKNSDFVVSIKKDYYIFNFMDKYNVDDGLYLNENTGFYENYNSGATCSIYSCVNGEKFLFGFLACDSLLDANIRKNFGRNIYDYNVANLLMSTAHILALYLGEFLEVWNNKYLNEAYKVACSNSNSTNTKKTKDTFKAENNLCAYMRKKYKNARYSK